MDANRLKSYSSLLVIRRVGARQSTFVTGVLFFTCLALILVFAVLDGLTKPSLILIAIILVPLGFGFVMSWVRHEIIKELIRLLDEL